MKLRPKQELTLNLARQAIRDGFKRPLIASPTGSGKTVIAAQMMLNCQKAGKKGYFFCDRIKLVDQTVATFEKFGIDFGVMQADHPLKNSRASIQIASVQTFAAMVAARNGRLPEFDFAIIDEASTQYDILKTIMRTYNNIPIIGFDATPYTKGLGKLFNKLIVPVTHRELLADGLLCPINYYIGEHIDISKIRSAGANSYSQEDLEQETATNKEILTGCILRNWFKWGDNAQTIAFSPSKDHSKYLVGKFNEGGVDAEHIDCHTPQGERDDLYEAHNNGEFKVLSCSRLLGVGYDSPSTRVLIDCYPVKSVKTYVQRAGRIARILDGKENAVYLDHAGNFERFGYAEDIVPTELHDGEKPHKEAELTSMKDKKEPQTQDCPKCYQAMAGRSCKACGYEKPIEQCMEDDGSMLVEVGNKHNKNTPMDVKEQFYSELKLYAKQKGYKDTWAGVQYKIKFDVYPNGIRVIGVDKLSPTTKGWIQHQNIKRAKSKVKGEATIKNMRAEYEPTTSGAG